jgi:nucleoside-diphosphate-sugar epimerase
MAETVFLAGATGVVGRRLVPLLRQGGYTVIGTTRSVAKTASLERQGAIPVVVDVLNADAVLRAMTDARPTIVIHQLTDLSAAPGTPEFPATLERTMRLRIEGTANVMAAARVTSVRRAIAQSVAFVYAPGEGARVETDPVMTDGVALGAIPLERAVLGTPALRLLLRTGHLVRRPANASGAARRRRRPRCDVGADARRARHLQHRSG